MVAETTPKGAQIMSQFDTQLISESCGQPRPDHIAFMRHGRGGCLKVHKRTQIYNDGVQQLHETCFALLDETRQNECEMLNEEQHNEKNFQK